VNPERADMDGVPGWAGTSGGLGASRNRPPRCQGPFASAVSFCHSRRGCQTRRGRNL